MKFNLSVSKQNARSISVCILHSCCYRLWVIIILDLHVRKREDSIIWGGLSLLKVLDILFTSLLEVYLLSLLLLWSVCLVTNKLLSKVNLDKYCGQLFTDAFLYSKQPVCNVSLFHLILDPTYIFENPDRK